MSSHNRITGGAANPGGGPAPGGSSSGGGRGGGGGGGWSPRDLGPDGMNFNIGLPNLIGAALGGGLGYQQGGTEAALGSLAGLTAPNIEFQSPGLGLQSPIQSPVKSVESPVGFRR